MSQRKRDKKVYQRPLYPRFLIVYEGKKTEPNYFKHISRHFNRGTVNIKVYAFGGSGLSLIEAAVAQSKRVSYDQVWCVFDRDQLPPDIFSRMCKRATENGFRVAYSNPCFELWYLLHFERWVQWIDCNMCIDKLQYHLQQQYTKTSVRFLPALDPQQDQAIEYAATLLNRSSPPDPANDNPSTTVHLLINELRRFFP